MPSRIIRESCRTSKTLNKLSDGAERFFWRLITVADDWGRFDADLQVLISLCFPLRSNVITCQQMSAFVSELVNIDAIRIYNVEEKEYGYFVNWSKHQRVRSKQSKFPDPKLANLSTGNKQDIADKCQQTLTNAPVVKGYEVRGKESELKGMESKVLGMGNGEEGEKGKTPVNNLGLEKLQKYLETTDNPDAKEIIKHLP